MSGDGDPHILAGNLGQKLPVRHVAVEANLLIFNGWGGAADV